MKKITAKEVKATHVNVIQVGYCELGNLLTFKQPYAYTSGVYGWNADVYSYGTTAIVTGYRPFGKKVNPGTYKTYETMAGLVMADKNLSWEEKEVKVTGLLEDFMEVLGCQQS